MASTIRTEDGTDNSSEPDSNMSGSEASHLLDKELPAVTLQMAEDMIMTLEALVWILLTTFHGCQYSVMVTFPKRLKPTLI
ncbi:hypothetical protein NDU88_001053 [Pleurodeles waltl]|uniref:Uncharacterized protein n=1 Tax=Pleurodeles waltl TaxID=8319 RepID=A0AAV7SY71_PLEWA|nr:hypothetical protein NDU88_001053 [Pleurodeles waltl]